MGWKARHRRRRRGRIDPLSIAQLLDGRYVGRAADRPLVRTFSWWDRTVPRRIAERARPVRLHEGTLVVHTATSAWAQELSFHERDLLASVQKEVPSVRRLRISVGPMPPPPPPPLPIPPKTIPLRVTQLPSDVARELARIGDDRLRDALTRAACTSLAPPASDGAPPKKR